MANDIIRIRRDTLTNWTAQNPTLGLGEISYNTTDKEIRIGDNSTAWLNLPPIKAFVDSEFKTVYNNSGSPINKGEVVYVTGSHSQTALTVAKADASTEATAATTIGVAYETISNSAYGKIILQGFITGLDTNTVDISGAEGSILWLSETAGSITSTKPTAPSHGVVVGFLVKKNDTTGIIYVKITNGQELEELHDVKVVSLANNNILQYKSSSQTWENVSTVIGTDSIWAAKGDLIVGTGNDTASILTVDATNGYILTVDNTTATGLKWAANSGGVGDGDKGDITVSNTGTTWTIDSDAVTFAKMQNIAAATLLGRESGAGTGDIKTILLDPIFVWTTIGGLPALTLDKDSTKANISTTITGSDGLSGGGDLSTNRSLTLASNGVTTAKIADGNVTLAKLADMSSDKLLGRFSIGTGAVEQITCTAAGRALLDDANTSDQRATLGLGTLATQNGTFSGTSSGTNTGDQNIFQTISVAGQSNIIADSTTDTLTLVAGAGLSITTNAASDEITFTRIGEVADGDKGDITVSGAGTTWTIDNDVVTYAKLQNISATDKLLGRSSAGSGDAEEITCTAAGRALLDDADATAQRTTLGLGTLATQNGTFSGTSSGTNTGDQTITLTGEVTGSGTGSFAATIANNAVTYAKIQDVSETDRILGRSSAGSGDIEEIVCTSVARNLLDDTTSAAQRTTLGLGTADSPQFTSVTLANGEFIRNSTNGRIDFMPVPTGSTAYGMYFDMTSWTAGVAFGNIRTNDNALNVGNFRFDAPVNTGNNVDIGLGSSNWYTISHRETGSQAALTVGLLLGTQNSGSSGSMVLVQNNERGGANRIPTTDHADPTLYVYGRGSSNANDFVRLNHNTTDGYLEAGRGTMRITGASGVRMDSTYGFGVAPTAVQTGYTTFTNLTTDRTCDANATTVEELADILGTLIVDLKAKGIISA